MTVAHCYTHGLTALAQKDVDFVSDTVMCLLMTETYTPDQDADFFISSLTGEVVGGSYSRVALTSKTNSQAAGVVTLSCDNVAFAAFSADPGVRYAVFAVDTGVPTTSPLLCWMDFEAATVVASQPGTVTIPVGGLITLTAV